MSRICASLGGAFGVSALTLSMAQAPLCVDPSFQAPFTQGVISDVDFMSNGQILIGGHMKNPAAPGGAITYLGWSRLDPDGSIDPSFDQNIGSTGHAVRIWNEEYFFTTPGGLARRCFLATGTPDTEYKYPYPEFSASGGDFYTFPNEKLWLTGWHIKRILDADGNLIGSEPGYGLIQVLPNGRTDPDFDHKFTSPGWMTSICETSDGRFLFGSTSAAQYEGRPVGGILRVWPDGHLDTTFHSTISWGHPSSKYYFYPDGRILTFGRFQVPEYPGDTLAILRLHPDGSTDTTWPAIAFRNPHYFFPALATVNGFLEIEPGKLIIVGDFVMVNGQPAGGLAAIDTAGTVLWNYFTGTGAGAIQQSFNSYERYLRGIERAPDGYIYIYGAYQGFDDGCGNHPNQRLITRLYPLNVGVDEAEEARSMITVIPNPGNDHILLRGLEHSGLVSVTIFDTRGVLAWKGVVQPRASMDVSTLAPGFYSVVLRTDAGSTRHLKWIKE